VLFNKKGEIGYKEIFAVIFVLLFAVMWFAFQNLKFKPAQDQFFDVETCRLSVLKASLKGFGVNSLEELRGCKTQEPVIDEIDPDYVNNILAKSMDLCWYQFGRGKVDFLKTLGGKRKGICFVCSKITFQSNVDEINKNSFEKFLQESETNLNIKPPILLSEDGIKENDVLYTVFVASRVKEYDFFDYYTLAPLDPFRQSYYYVYGTEFRSGLILAPRNKISEECTVI
jgi:hypothetical protein